MAQNITYGSYQIEPDVFQHKDGKLRGCWGSNFRVSKDGEVASASIVAAAGEKSATAAESKALNRAKAMIDEWLERSENLASARSVSAGPHPFPHQQTDRGQLS